MYDKSMSKTQETSKIFKDGTHGLSYEKMMRAVDNNHPRVTLYN